MRSRAVTLKSRQYLSPDSVVVPHSESHAATYGVQYPAKVEPRQVGRRSFLQGAIIQDVCVAVVGYWAVELRSYPCA
jgi:hypothetical protein